MTAHPLNVRVAIKIELLRAAKALRRRIDKLSPTGDGSWDGHRAGLLEAALMLERRAAKVVK